jgi:hypothetical protein
LVRLVFLTDMDEGQPLKLICFAGRGESMAADTAKILE